MKVEVVEHDHKFRPVMLIITLEDFSELRHFEFVLTQARDGNRIAPQPQLKPIIEKLEEIG